MPSLEFSNTFAKPFANSRLFLSLSVISLFKSLALEPKDLPLACNLFTLSSSWFNFPLIDSEIDLDSWLSDNNFVLLSDNWLISLSRLVDKVVNSCYKWYETL